MWLQSSKENDTSLDEEPMLSTGHERQSILLEPCTRHPSNWKHPRTSWMGSETLMPEKGAKSRGEIMAWLAALAHEKVTDSEMGELLGRLEERDDLDESEQANVREFRKRYDKATKLSAEFVSEFAQARSEALVAWQKPEKMLILRFLPHLQTLVDLTEGRSMRTDTRRHRTMPFSMNTNLV